MSDIVERLRAGEWGADVEAAAEIEQLRDQDNAWITTVRKQEEELVRLRKSRATTIEECAQVAETFHCAQCGVDAATAIRALKEQS